jgi:hypothetical protein
MNSDPEEFEKLQKLLKLKRHEQPPPGYFNNFSTLVIHRLERESEQGVLADAPWIRRFLGLLETNPIAAGLFGMSVCGLLISGIAWSQYRPPSEYSGPTSLNFADSGAGAVAAPAFSRTASVDSLAPSFGATNPASLFDTHLSAMPVVFPVNQ